MGNIEQELAADSAPIVFDEVKIAGRDAALLRKLRLFQPRHHAPLTDAAAGQPLTHGTAPRDFSPVVSRSFCAAISYSLQAHRCDCEYIYKKIVSIKRLIDRFSFSAP
jgi:hypothetical protein